MSDFYLTRLGLSPIQDTPFLNLIMESGLDPGGKIWFSGSRIEWILQAPEAVTVTRLGFRYASTVLPTLGVPRQKISIQGVTGLGIADGAPITQGFYTPKTNQDPPGEDWNGTWQWVDVPAAAISRGQFIAIVIEYDSGPIAQTGPYSLYNSYILNTTPAKGGFPYNAVNPSGVRIVKDDRMIVGYGSSSKFYGWPILSLISSEYTGPAQKALRFKLDSGWGDTYKVAGVVWQGRHVGASGKSYSVRLYDGTNEIGRTAVDGDFGSGGFSIRTGIHQILFDESVLPTLNMGEEYFVAIVPDAGVTSILEIYECPGNSELSAFPGGGEFYYAERDDAGDDWDRFSARRPLIDLIISEWGAPVEEEPGIHVKVTPLWNDALFIQHADDQIENNLVEIPSTAEPHEYPGIPIGNTIESYSGYKTVEVFKDPDAARSPEFMIHAEQNIEGLKFIRWQPWENGTFEILFRLRAAEGSAVYKEVTRYVRVITTP